MIKKDKPFIITFSEYSGLQTGFGTQMASILPYLRREFNVIEIGVGARPEHAHHEIAKGNILVPTVDDFGDSVKGEFYGQSAIKKFFYEWERTGRKASDIGCCFINHDVQAVWYVGQIFRQANIPMVLWSLIDNEYLNQAAISVLTIPDVLLFQTRFGFETTKKHAPFLDGKVIYPAIDTDRWPTVDPAKVPQLQRVISAKEGGNKKMIAFIGKNQPRKNPAVFLDAINCLKDRDDLCFLMHAPGTRPMSGELDENRLAGYTLDIKDYLARKKIPMDRVLLSWEIAEHEVINALYQVIDVLVLPSCAEGFGMPFLEAWHKGPVVVTTNHGVMSEVGGENRAILVDPAMVTTRNDEHTPASTWAYLDGQELANKIVHAASLSIFERDVYAQAGKAFLKQYNVSKQARELVSVIQEMCDKKLYYQRQLPVQIVM